MAKVTGPLMSIDASGGFGGAMVFGKWNGRNVVHRLVTPSNPQTVEQQDNRNHIRATGAIQRFVRLTMLNYPGDMTPDLEQIKLLTPVGQAWNGFLVKSTIGPDHAQIDASDAAFAALTPVQRTAYDDAADALVPPLPSVVQVHEYGVPNTYKSAGNIFFNYLYGRAAALSEALPGAVPPVYA